MAALTTGLALLSGASALYQHKKGREAAKGAERMAEFEASLLDSQADDAIARGAEEEAKFRAGVKKLKGSQRVALASQGIDINTGSALAVQEETEVLSELDALTIRNNARREAWGFKTQGQLTRAAGFGQAQSIRNQATSTLLTGVAGAASTYLGSRSRVPKTQTKARPVKTGFDPRGFGTPGVDY